MRNYKIPAYTYSVCVWTYANTLWNVNSNFVLNRLCCLQLFSSTKYLDLLPQLEQELTDYNSLPCSITSSNYQEENAINLCNGLPLCYNIQSEVINASCNKEKNYYCVLFYSTGSRALETTRGSQGKLSWSNSGAIKRSPGLTLYNTATQPAIMFLFTDPTQPKSLGGSSFLGFGSEIQLTAIKIDFSPKGLQ